MCTPWPERGSLSSTRNDQRGHISNKHLSPLEYLIRSKDEVSLIRGITEININYVAQVTEYKIDFHPKKPSPFRA